MMETVAAAAKLFTMLNVAAEGVSAFTSIQSTLYQLQQKRLAQGKPISEADVDALMAEGDVKAVAEAATLAAARLAKLASEQ